MEIIRNAKNGDFTGLEEWMRIHSKKVEHFAFQYGLTLEKAYEVTLDTFITFREKLASVGEHEQLVHVLYTILCRKLANYETSISDDVFPFKEDAELHLEIVQLDEEFKVPFILSLFQGLPNKQITAIIGESAVEVERRIRRARELLGEGTNGKQLELLGKSYNRLPVRFEVEQIGTMQQPEINTNTFMKKSVLWPIIGLFMLAVSIIAIQLILSNKNEPLATEGVGDAYFAELEERYKVERDKRQEIIQLADDRFNKLNFIQTADERINSIKNSTTKGEHRQPQDLEVEFEKAINDLKPPSEMIMDVLGSDALIEDEEASIEHLSILHDKVNDLIAVYNGILWDYRETIEDFEEGSQKAALMMLESTKFPEELRNMIDTMLDQSLKLCTTKNTGEIKACFFNSRLYTQLQNQYYYYTLGYVNMLTYDYYRNYTNVEYGPRWVAAQLEEIQNTVIHAKQDEKLYPLLESYYTLFFYSIVKGIDEPLEELESVQLEYRTAWEQLFSHDEATPFSYLGHPIIEEMKTSEWQRSNSWEQFNRDKITEALKLARDGELEELMYGKMPIVENDMIEFPNPLFAKKVEELYNEFKQSYDNTIFKELSPLYVVGVYDYANEMEDPETMFYLFDEDSEEFMETFNVGSLTSYVENWEKGFSLFKDAIQVEFVANELMRYRKNFYADIKITYDGMDDWHAGIWLDENGIWYVRNIWHRPLPSSEEHPEVLITDVFQDHIPMIYEVVAGKNEHVFSMGSALDIVMLYFYTAELGDLESQYALYYQGEGSELIEKEQYIKEEMSRNFQMKMEDMFKTISFKAEEQDENGNWFGTAKLTTDLEKNPGADPVKNINMIWTDQGWRIMYNPME